VKSIARKINKNSLTCGFPVKVAEEGLKILLNPTGRDKRQMERNIVEPTKNFSTSKIEKLNNYLHIQIGSN
jgi:dihydropteroate synthase